MRRARGLTMLALVALLVALPTSGAGSAELTEHGWWWQPQTGLLGVPVPTPPDVPEDGLLVEQGPDGPTAVAAVRFLVGSDEVDPVLVLEVAGATGDGAIVACPAAVRWQPAQAGRWDTAPPADCEAGRVEGVPDESGSAWSFALGPLASADGVVDVVLRPAAAAGPSRVAFTAPDDASVVVQTQPPPPPPPPMPTAEPATGGQPAPPPVAVAPPPVAAPAPAPAAPEPQVAAPAPPAPAAEQPPPPLPPVAAPSIVETGPTPAALFLLVLLGLLIVVDLAAGVREQGLLAFVRTPDRAVRGGIGRFERERTEAPAPLW